MKHSPTSCVARLARGDNHALPDLLDALEAAGDLRFHVLGERMARAMAEIAFQDSSDPRFLISTWQSLCLFAIDLMAPRRDSLVAAIAKHAGRG